MPEVLSHFPDFHRACSFNNEAADSVSALIVERNLHDLPASFLGSMAAAFSSWREVENAGAGLSDGCPAFQLEMQRIADGRCIGVILDD